MAASAAHCRHPLQWNYKAAESHTSRPRVLCNPLIDIFEDWQGPIVDHLGMQIRQHSNTLNRSRTTGICNTDIYLPLTMTDLRRDLFALIDATPHLDWVLLTEWLKNIRTMWPSQWIGQDGQNYYNRINNIWLLTSISTQADAKRSIPHLLKCRDLVPVLGLSCKPLLGPIQLDVVDVDKFCSLDCLRGERSYSGRGYRPGHTTASPSFDWITVGGESGPHARPMHPDWARSLRDQCQAAGVPFYFEGWGDWAPHDQFPEWSSTKSIRSNQLFSLVGSRKSGRLLDGREWNETP